MEINLMYPEEEIIAAIKELHKPVLRCPKCNSVYIDSDIETLLFRKKNMIKVSGIRGANYMCSNATCFYYGQYLSKMEVENRNLLALLAQKFKELGSKVKELEGKIPE